MSKSALNTHRSGKILAHIGRRSYRTLLAISSFGLMAVSVQAQVLLDNGNLSGWNEKSFDGNTRYQASNGVLVAEANDSGSGYFYENEIPVNSNSTLSWRWKVDQFPNAGNEKIKSGDDFAARVYVLKKGFLGIANAKAIVYVWSQTNPVGSSWENPFTDKAIQVVVSSAQPGNWQSVQRNVVADFKRYHGMDIDHIDAVAIMTDSDNANGVARASYDDIQIR